jgi:predicted dehydrogenase
LIANPEVDVIDVCLPTTAHEEVAIAALQTGKHVICEKPLARTSAEARAIADAARVAKGFFMPAMVMRFWPQWVWLKKVVSEKTYGSVLAATFRRVAQMPPGWYHNGKISGGAALDLHIHDTDFVHHLFGMPKSVCSSGYSMSTGEIDHLSTQFMYDDVSLVTAEGGWTMAPGFGFSMRYLVNFSDGATADFDLARENPLMLSRDGKTEPVECPTGFGYEAELRYFIDCVRNNERPSTVTAEDGVASVRLIEAEVESVRTKKPVTL